MFKFLLMLILLVIAPIVRSIDHSNPYNLMNDSAKKIFTRLKNQRDKIYQNPDYLRIIVREEMLPYVHVKYAGALVLGKYYRNATQAQRNDYFKAFQAYLEQTYGQALSFYSNQDYQISPARLNVDKEIATVRVKITDKSDQTIINIDFQWRRNSISNDWQIYDMVIEGVSLISTKQNEWASTLRKKGVDGLTQQLHYASAQTIKLHRKYSV